MAKIIRLDSVRRPEADATTDTRQCPHKHVTVYTAQRTVHCSACNALLDPFDTLVDMMQTMPPDDSSDDLRRFLKEVAKRSKPAPE